VARQLAAALAAAHAEGIVHRDVKPANVLFDAAGNVRLADFGIAKLAGHDVTRTREVLGTLGYLAPEQLEGEPVDHRADLWAFGVTLHEMVAGQRPFAGETVAALLRAILADAPPSLPPARGAPPALAALIERLLAKAPAERPASAAEVEAMLASMAGGAARASPRLRAPGRTRRRAAVALAVLLPLAALGTVMATRGRDGRDGPDAPSAALPVQASVAVLPFESAGSAGDEPFAAGLTEEVIGALGRVPGLKVSSRTSTAALRARGLGARSIADTLGVRTVLEASVRRDGDRLRVAARLVRATDEQVLWAERYDRRRRDVFQVQEELAGAIVAALQPRLGAAGGQAAGTGTSARRVPVGTTDLTAYDDYLRGRFLRMRRSEESLALATRHFTRAIARDSAFAPAWAALANTTVLQVVFGNRPPAEMFPAARAAALRALALDSTVAEAHTALGHVLRNHDFDWDGSLARTARAMTLAPNDGTARVQHAITLLHLGRFDEAGAVLAAAHAVDPLDVTVFMTRGRLHLAAGRVPAAIGDLRTSVELNPAFSYAHEQLGFALLAGGHTAQAMGAFRRAAALSGVRDSAYLAWALATTGAPDTARAIVAGLEHSMAARYVPPLGIAAAHAALGDADRAFRWLDRAAAGRAAYLDGLSVHPAFGALYADPRWPRLLARLGLPRALRPLHPRL
jgi:serine/threonine-protein kinase